MPILSMAISKQDAEKSLHSLLPQIVCHIIKLCAVASTHDEHTHWAQEVDTWMDTINTDITNLKTPSGVLGKHSINQQVDSCRPLQPQRVKRTQQYIEARWAKNESRPLVWSVSDITPLLQHIHDYLIGALYSMVDDTWEYDVLLDPDFIALLESYGVK